MNVNLIVIDDFYSNPHGVRDFALSQEFSVTGNYPGSRTQPHIAEGVKEAIEHNMQFAGKITDWMNHDPNAAYTGAFQLATAGDRTWIHADHHNMWAGVIYLTPDAPFTGGTALYRYKETGAFRRTGEECDRYEGYDYTKWDKFDVIGNKFNRLIIYRGDLFHASLDYFGDSKENGRLFQTFFFNTEHY
jgi:hypothetical protein